VSPQYVEHGRRKPHPLPTSSLEHPWVLVRYRGWGQPSAQVAYLINERDTVYTGVLLVSTFYDYWELFDEVPRLFFVPSVDVLHVFPHEPNQEAVRKARLSVALASGAAS